MRDIRSTFRLSSRKITPWQQFLTQLLLVLVGIFVIVPIWGLLRVALDSSIRSVPTSFSLFPQQPSLAVFQQVWHTPSQALTFLGLLRNSLLVSGACALVAVVMGASMAYAFARFRFRGRDPGLLAILVGAFLPLVALMTPLYILLETLGLRSSLVGLIVVYTAFALPFCIWNMRAAFQSIPAEMEEAALLDGASVDFADTATSTGLVFQTRSGGCGCSSAGAPEPAVAVVGLEALTRRPAPGREC